MKKHIAQKVAAILISVLFLSVMAFAAVDYDKSILEIKKKIEQNPSGAGVDKMYYEIAEMRIKELADLAKSNDIDSIRRYMKVSDEYFNEAIDSLDKAERTTKSGELKLDILFLKFLIAKEKFESSKVDALFGDMANKIATFSKDPAVNKGELDRISEKLDKSGFSKYAIKLKIMYAEKVDQKSAIAVIEEIKDDADRLFDSGDTKKADTLYAEYVNIAGKIFDEDKVASGLVSIADKYFNSKKYDEAIRYYDKYLADYDGLRLSDYCTYRVALCLDKQKMRDQAIIQYTSFLNNYPDSKWFNDGFKDLARLYYEDKVRQQAFSNLRKLKEKYSKKDVRDYVEILIAILYYGSGEYDNSVKQCKALKKEFPESSYVYTADTLIEDIRKIQDEGDKPSYSVATKGTYNRWEPYTPVEAEIIPEVMDGKSVLSLNFEFPCTSAYAADNPEGSKTIKIGLIEGDVTIFSSDIKKWQKGASGMMLKKGDRIKTGADSSCDLLFDGKTENVVGILENSEIVLILGKNEKVEIIDAHLFARLSDIPAGSTFEIKTPIAACGARGTGFSVKGDKSTMEATAYENDIFLRNKSGQESNISEGFARTMDQAGQISEALKAEPKSVAKFDSWPTYLTVKPGTKINFVINEEKLVDMDKLGEFVRDESDASRLPRKIEDRTEADLLSIDWTIPEGGFTGKGTTLMRTWQAPKKEGVYKISIKINDLGLVRPPDEGVKKDEASHMLTVIVTVEK